MALFPGRWRWVAAALVTDHIAVVVSGLSPRSALLGPNIRRLPAWTPGNDVGLTFDDGPDPHVTPRVLDLLDRHSARASFFCVGRKAESFPDIAQEIARRGHSLENHSYDHPPGFFFHGPAALRREIDRTQETLERISGRRPRFFRAPAGIRSPLLQPILARRGLALVSWTRRGFDSMSRDSRSVLARLVRNLSARDILLLHDGAPRPCRDGSPVVLEVLPRLLDCLSERSLRPVAIPGEASGVPQAVDPGLARNG